MKPHYLLHEPGLGLPLVALAVNLLVITALWQWSARDAQRVSIGWSSTAPPSAVPQIQLTGTGQLELNNVPVNSREDLQFRLSALSANGNQVRVEFSPDLPSDQLSDVLRICSQSGFTGVILQQSVPGRERGDANVQ